MDVRREVNVFTSIPIRWVGVSGVALLSMSLQTAKGLAAILQLMLTKARVRSTSSTSAKSSTSQQAKAKAKYDPKKKAAPKGKGKPKPQPKASAAAASSSTGQAQTAEILWAANATQDVEMSGAEAVLPGTGASATWSYSACSFYTTYTPAFHSSEPTDEDGILPPILDTGATHCLLPLSWLTNEQSLSSKRIHLKVASGATVQALLYQNVIYCATVKSTFDISWPVESYAGFTNGVG